MPASSWTSHDENESARLLGKRGYNLTNGPGLVTLLDRIRLDRQNVLSSEDRGGIQKLRGTSGLDGSMMLGRKRVESSTI